MIDEALLERLLAEEAATYNTPPDGPERVLAASYAAPPRRSRQSRRAPRLAAAAVVLIAVAFGVPLVQGGGGRGGISTSAPEGTRARVDSLAYDKDASTSGGAGTPGGLGEKAGADAKVVRTGDLSLEVPKARVADTVRAASAVAAKYGGYVSDSSSETAGEHPVGSVTVRVPVAAFDAAFADLGRLGDVRESGTKGEDVTEQVADTAARLRSLTATRGQLETLLARAKDVGEVLAVQQRMTEVQTQIEQLQAKQKTLADSTSYGTLRVVVQPPDAGERSGFAKAWHDAVDGFVGGFEWLVAASGSIAFALILSGVLLLLGRAAYRYWVRGVV